MARTGPDGRKADKRIRDPRTAQHTPRGVLEVKYPERLRIAHERVEQQEGEATSLELQASTARAKAIAARAALDRKATELTPRGSAPKRRADLWPITKLEQMQGVSKSAQRRIEAEALADIEAMLNQ
jgi:hypothetical protein